jgi:hypothetical protein
MITDSIYSARNAMSITEITGIFNTTDKPITFVNTESKRDYTVIDPLGSISLATKQTDGAWIPWFDPPMWDDFPKRHMRFEVDGKPVLYFWQRQHYIYWCTSMTQQNIPAQFYKMLGIGESRGRRKLIFRYDPDFGYSAFFKDVDDPILK